MKHTLSVCSGFAFGFAPAFADRCLIGLGWVFDRHSIYIRYKFDQMFNLCWNLASISVGLSLDSRLMALSGIVNILDPLAVNRAFRARFWWSPPVHGAVLPPAHVVGRGDDCAELVCGCDLPSVFEVILRWTMGAQGIFRRCSSPVGVNRTFRTRCWWSRCRLGPRVASAVLAS